MSTTLKTHVYQARQQMGFVLGNAGITPELAAQGYVATLCLSVNPVSGAECETVDIHLRQAQLDSLEKMLQHRRGIIALEEDSRRGLED